MNDQPNPVLSSDFLTGSTLDGLNRIRTRLLDLTNRNKLLNFRHSTSSSLRFVQIDIDNVFERLRENEKLSLLPVPEPRSDDISADERAAELGWNTSHDLDRAPDA